MAEGKNLGHTVIAPPPPQSPPVVPEEPQQNSEQACAPSEVDGMLGCTEGCWDDEACLFGCAESINISGECIDCAQDFSFCSAEACREQCEGDGFGGVQCRVCLQQNGCTDALAECGETHLELPNPASVINLLR